MRTSPALSTRFTRALVYVVIVAAIVPIAPFVSRVLNDVTGNRMVGSFTLPLLLILATAGFLGWQRKSLEYLGLPLRLGRVGAAVAGLLAGAVMFVVRTTAVMLATGQHVRREDVPSFSAAAGTLLVLFSSVIVEELIFRGYLFRESVERFGAVAATAAFGVLFGIYHWAQWGLWDQPLAMAFALIGTGSAHVLFAVAFLRTRSLYLPIGLHLGWNWADSALHLTGENGTAAFLVGFVISEFLLLIATVIILRRVGNAARRSGVPARGAPKPNENLIEP